MRLSDAKEGKVRIKKIDDEIKNRFLSIGILEGLEVEVIKNDGSIVIIRLFDKIFGLDKNVADMVEVDGV